MSNDTIINCVNNNLIINEDYQPERLGIKKVLFEREFSKQLIELYMVDNNSTPFWTASNNGSYLESLFLLLSNFFGKNSHWLYITYPDDAWAQLEWIRSAEQIERTWRYITNVFETTSAEQNGTQVIALLSEDQSRIVQIVSGFYRKGVTNQVCKGLELSLFGASSFSEEICQKLEEIGSSRNFVELD